MEVGPWKQLCLGTLGDIFIINQNLLRLNPNKHLEVAAPLNSKTILTTRSAPQGLSTDSSVAASEQEP